MMPPAYLRGPTDVLPSVQIPYWCAGKESFDSAVLASEVARRSGKGPREHYWCRSCGSYHVGTHRRGAEAAKFVVAELVRSR
jgi:hypothetical protein